MAISSSENDDVVSEINITPLVDVMLVLLIVFIVTAPLLTHSVKLNLPKAAQTQSTSQNKATVISVKDDGAVYIDQKQIQLAQFEQELGLLKKSQTDLVVNLNADEKVAYGVIAKLLASIERVGVDKLSVLTLPQ